MVTYCRQVQRGVLFDLDGLCLIETLERIQGDTNRYQKTIEAIQASPFCFRMKVVEKRVHVFPCFYIVETEQWDRIKIDITTHRVIPKNLFKIKNTYGGDFDELFARFSQSVNCVNPSKLERERTILLEEKGKLLTLKARLERMENTLDDELAELEQQIVYA